MDGDIDSKAFGYYPLNYLGREFCFNLTSKHLVDFRNGKNKLTHLNKQWDNNVAVIWPTVTASLRKLAKFVSPITGKGCPANFCQQVDVDLVSFSQFSKPPVDPTERSKVFTFHELYEAILTKKQTEVCGKIWNFCTT